MGVFWQTGAYLPTLFQQPVENASSVPYVSQSELDEFLRRAIAQVSNRVCRDPYVPSVTGNSGHCDQQLPGNEVVDKLRRGRFWIPLRWTSSPLHSGFDRLLVGGSQLGKLCPLEQ